MDLAQIGVYGLGTMGSALALNMADHGFKVAVTNREIDWIKPFIDEAGNLAKNLTSFDDLESFVLGLAKPRVILFMIPSTKPMDMMIKAVSPLLDEGDTIIDGGNANFHDTRRRSALMAEQNLHFVGMGVSGGENGARNGPSMMVGGSDHSWTQLKPILQAISAKHQNDPCADHLGPDGAGHFVKTVHNGIEYADMQGIAEIYMLLRDAANWSPEKIGKLFEGWNDGPLASYLVEISAAVLQAKDSITGNPITEIIVDQAGQKGTGRWTAIEALKLGQSGSAIEAAVGARAWSSEKQTREVAQSMLKAQTSAANIPTNDDLAAAFMVTRILGHAQGFRVLKAASDEYDWSLDMARIAEIWRAGCIIRSALLDDISEAFQGSLPQGELILAPVIREILNTGIGSLRRVVSAAISAGIPVPVMSGALAWYDSIRTARGAANMIQAQRDFFGAHGFKRVDQDGNFHGPWWG